MKYKVWCKDCGLGRDPQPGEWRTYDPSICVRCIAIKAKYPDLYDWMLALVHSRLEDHRDDYKHEYA